VPRLFYWLSVPIQVNWAWILIATIVFSYMTLIVTAPIERIRNNIRMASN
jgi:hypothetical protein